MEVFPELEGHFKRAKIVAIPMIANKVPKIRELWIKDPLFGTIHPYHISQSGKNPYTPRYQRKLQGRIRYIILYRDYIS
jgi:hypothetical protein